MPRRGGDARRDAAAYPLRRESRQKSDGRTWAARESRDRTTATPPVGRSTMSRYHAVGLTPVARPGTLRPARPPEAHASGPRALEVPHIWLSIGGTRAADRIIPRARAVLATEGRAGASRHEPQTSGQPDVPAAPWPLPSSCRPGQGFLYTYLHYRCHTEPLRPPGCGQPDS